MIIRKAEIRDIEKVAQLMQINGYDREGAVRRANSIGSNGKLMLVLEKKFDLWRFTSNLHGCNK